MRKAKARGPNHVFRAEVHCKSAGTRLVREEMTRYYQDNPTAQQVPQERSPSNDDRLHDYQRTAERQVPMPLPQSPDLAVPTPAFKR